MDKSIAPVLNFVESQEVPINKDMLDGLAASLMLDFDLDQMSAALFGFMNGILSGEAHTVLRTVQDVNGLEVW